MLDPRHYSRQLIAGLLFALLPQAALAYTLLNGDFEDLNGGLTYWSHVVGNVSVTNDSAYCGPVPTGFGDTNDDGKVTLADAGAIQACFAGVGNDHAGSPPCETIDLAGVQPHALEEADVQAFFCQFEDTVPSSRVLLLRESTYGGISRVSQQFTLPTDVDPSVLSFQYRFVTRGGPTNAVPPDSLEVYLTDPDGNRLVIDASAPPAYTFATFGSRAFFYVDSDAAAPYDPTNPGDAEDELVFDASNVFVSRESVEGFRTVVIDISSLSAGAEVLLEFGLTSGRNNVTTYAAIDNVNLGCAPDYGFCCDADGNVTFLDDGDSCTDDRCDEDGVAQHTEMTYCLECINPDGNTDILFMIDVSRSLPGNPACESQGNPDYDGLGAIKSAIETLLNLYRPYMGRPAIGVGRCATWIAGDGHAVIDQTPTTDYSIVQDVLDALEYPDSCGVTPLAAGINLATNELEEATVRRRYIVLITDGFPIWPPGIGDCTAVPDCGLPLKTECTCKEAREFVDIAAHDARVNKGIRIYAKLFYSTSYGLCKDDYDRPGNVDDNYCVREWMINNVVSGEQAFFGTAGDLTPEDGRVCNECEAEITSDLVKLIQVIECDDGNPCTLDRCVDGKCVHIKIYGCDN